MIFNYKNIAETVFIKRYFDVLNTAQPDPEKLLSESEIIVLAGFLMLPDKFNDKRYGTLARQKVCESVSNTYKTMTRQNLQNKIYALIEKGLLYRDDDGVIYTKLYIMKGIQAGLKALRNGGDFEMTFRFSYDKKRS